MWFDVRAKLAEIRGQSNAATVPLVTYLVAPYSHPNPEIVEDRVRAADAAMIALMNAGYTVYCPVCQWHRAALFYDVPTDAKYWREQNRAMLERLDVMHVLRLDGWLDSAGVAEEIRWAREMGLMVAEMDPLPAGNR